MPANQLPDLCTMSPCMCSRGTGMHHPVIEYWSHAAAVAQKAPSQYVPLNTSICIEATKYTQEVEANTLIVRTPPPTPIDTLPRGGRGPGGHKSSTAGLVVRECLTVCYGCVSVGPQSPQSSTWGIFTPQTDLAALRAAKAARLTTNATHDIC